MPLAAVCRSDVKGSGGEDEGLAVRPALGAIAYFEGNEACGVGKVTAYLG